jgi:hypothetical protein
VPVFAELVVLAVVAVLEADTTGFTAAVTVLEAVTFGRLLVAALAAETGALALGAGTGLGVTAGADGVATCTLGVAAVTLGVATLATGVLTVADGTVTPTEGTVAETAGAVAEGTAALTTGAGVVTAGVFAETPTTGTVTDTPGTVTPGTETLTPGRPAPCATAEPTHVPSASRETKTTGPRIPRMAIQTWCHRLASRNEYQPARWERAHTKN